MFEFLQKLSFYGVRFFDTTNDEQM